ncbi:hypothetical protein V6Z11_A10G213300 [Gossypium hirsutum]
MHRIFRCWTFAKEDCWSLFAKHALGDKDPDEESNLKRIGKGITLASMLHSEVEIEEWNNLLHTLRLSYPYLPSQLKRCLAYCSIFLKGHKFEKGDLIRMWVAEDLVQQLNSRRMEDAGEQYFHELLSGSIFQQSHLDQTRFEMHDFFKDDSALQNPARVRHLSCIWRLSDTLDKFLAFYGKIKVLRTFYLDHQVRAILVSTLESLENLFPSPSHLHVSSLSSCKITKFPGVCFLDNLLSLKLSRCLRITRLPTDMKDLTKLKHLDLKGAPLAELLNSIEICSLYNLQILKLSDCRSLTCLPPNMKNLIKLEHLDISRTHILQMPPRYGNLKRLQLLTCFVVGNNGVSGISEVKDLSLLRDTFSILTLQHVSRIEHAEMANLKDKKYLRELVLEWDAPCNGNTQSAGNSPPNGNMQIVNDLLNRNAENPAVEKAMVNPQNWNGKSAEDDLQNLCATHASNVLDKLHPGENLENLEIKNFFGMSLPNWLGNASFSKMERQTLENLQSCNSLPPLGQLPSLKELAILKLTEFSSRNEAGFPSFSFLVKLYIIGCEKLTGDLPIPQRSTLELTRSQGTTCQ